MSAYENSNKQQKWEYRQEAAGEPEAETAKRVTEHANEYPTMHCFGNTRHTQSMEAYMALTEYFWKFRR